MELRRARPKSAGFVYFDRSFAVSGTEARFDPFFLFFLRPKIEPTFDRTECPSPSSSSCLLRSKNDVRLLTVAWLELRELTLPLLLFWPVSDLPCPRAGGFASASLNDAFEFVFVLMLLTFLLPETLPETLLA